MGIYTIAWNETLPADCRNGALTIGNFDGVHRGHQALVAELCSQARAVKGPAVAVTFDPHPLQLLRPEKFQPVLTTVHDRAMLLTACKVDQVLTLRTTPELLQLSAGEFFDRVIRRQFQARVLVEGVNFGFGRNRQGNVETLKTMGQQAGIGVVVVPPFRHEGVIVSSSRIRSALMRGAVGEAAALLGRSYRITGTIGIGKSPRADDWISDGQPGERGDTRSRRRRLCSARILGREVLAGRRQHRAKSDFWRPGVQVGGTPDRLQRRRVRPAIGPGIRGAFARHKAVRRQGTTD